MKSWLVLVYRIPRNPTAGRVYVWRKLKQLGAVAVQDAVWVLPNSPRTAEMLQWLAAEITELQGEAMLWEAEQVYATTADALQRQFVEPVESEYRAILAALKKRERDLPALSKRFQLALAKDYFPSELSQQVRDMLLAVQERERS